MNAAKTIYRPVGILLGAAAGAVAAGVFHRTWRTLSGTDVAPAATDEDRGWGEILAAAALEGAIFAIVRAAADRAGAYGVRRLTGRWPS